MSNRDPELAEMDAEDARAERPRKPRYCIECNTTGGHVDGCPADDDQETAHEQQGGGNV